METEKKPLRVLAVGLGWVTTNRHLPVMTASPDYDVVGVADRRADRASSVARQFRVGRQFSSPKLEEDKDLSEIPWLDEVDAVTIGTSPYSHHALTMSALRAGKHVLTEKPFAMNPEEGEEMVAFAKAQGLTLSVVHNFQFARSMQRLLSDIDSGRLGKIQGVSGVVFGNPKRRLPDWYEGLPLGLYYDESPHLYYLLRAIAPGKLKSLQTVSFGSTKGHVTPAGFFQHFRCDIEGQPPMPIHLSFNFESALSEWHLQVHGERAFADVDIFRDHYIRVPNDEGHTAATIVRTSAVTTWQHWIQHIPSGIRHITGRNWYGNDEVFRRFADAAREGRQAENLTPEDALWVLQMQHDAINGRTKLTPEPSDS